MRFISSLLIVVFFICSTNLQAQERKKIGLVLSGGGAKGSAHVGVLKVLEKHNIPVDYIVGTSIGAYVAGMYALGYSAKDIEDIMLSLPWDDGYSDTIPRESLQFMDKQLRDKYNLAIRLGYSEGEFKVPHGLLLGQSAYQLLRQSTDTIEYFDSFDDLAIPYRAVASDIATAQAVILASGSINQAMRASAAVPGIVAAVEIDNKMLVDGGITNNMPIDVVKQMGADIVIAVDIGSPLSEQSELTSTVAVLNQLSTILTNNTSLAQKALLSPERDILIRPAIDDLSTTDWSILPVALELGEKEALNNLAKLTSLSVSNQEFAQYLSDKQQKSAAWFKTLPKKIVEIQYKNTSKVPENIIAQHFDIALGDSISKEALDLAINRVYALDKFEQVSVEFVDTDEGRVLQLYTKEKSWGPNYFDFGFSLQTDFSEHSVTTLNMAYKLTDVTPNGGQWLNELMLGWETAFATEFYQPLDQAQRYYGIARAEYVQEKWERTKKRQTKITNKYGLVKLGTGFNYSFNGIFELGMVGEKGDLSLDTEALGDYDYDSYGGYAKFAYDSLNSINFPTNGGKFTAEVLWREDSYSPLLTSAVDDTSVEITLDWHGAVSVRGHSFLGIASFATVENDTDFTVHVSELGGFLNLSGYREDALIGAHKAFAAIAYQYDLGREVPGGSGLPIYLGASIEAGNVWQINESVKLDDLITSGSLYLGTDTSFGPAVLGLGYASEGESTVFLSLGKNF